MSSGSIPAVRLLHFNDVYRLEPSEHDPVSAIWDRPPVSIIEPAEMDLSASEDEAELTAPALAREPSAEEHELMVARKAMRKWWRLAGLNKRHAMGYEAGEELGVGWTRGICPQVEGRIKMVLRVL